MSLYEGAVVLGVGAQGFNRITHFYILTPQNLKIQVVLRVSPDETLALGRVRRELTFKIFWSKLTFHARVSRADRGYVRGGGSARIKLGEYVGVVVKSHF